MTKIIMANNNKWLLYGFIILAILNIILLGYIVMGLSGKSVGLSPSGPASYCTDTSTGTFCFIGDKDGPTALELFRSKIIDSGTDYLEINSGAPKGVKINGDLNMSGKSINDFSFLKSSRSGINLPIESVTIYPSLMTYSSIKGTDRNAASISASTLTVSEIKDNKLKIANYTANGVILTSLNGYRWLCNPNNDGAFICVRIF